MRIVLVGHYPLCADEGVRNITSHIYDKISVLDDVMKVDIGNILMCWKDIAVFCPEIIHLIVGPSTILSFVISRFLSLYFRKAKIIMSAPHVGRIHLKKLIYVLKPDLILSQSYESENLFINLGCKTQFLPNGVDTKKFIPVTKKEKYKLREKYGVAQEKFIILHVGHIKSSRNISVLQKLQNEDNQLVIVGSTTTSIEKDILYKLKKSGCIIWTDYFKNIEEVYALSDCYIFPTIDRYNCIEMPLSVLEAMSCNLPVISTRFGALTRVFSEDNGLFFVGNNEFDQIIKKIKNDNIEIKTREKVFFYSWDDIAKNLDDIYKDVYNKKI